MARARTERLHSVIKKIFSIMRDPGFSPEKMAQAKKLINELEKFIENDSQKRISDAKLYQEIKDDVPEIDLYDDSKPLSFDTQYIEDYEKPFTMLMDASRHGHIELAELLLMKGANPNFESLVPASTETDPQTGNWWTYHQSYSALFCVCEFNRITIVNLLLSVKALNPNLGRDAHSGGPLGVAIVKDYLTIAHQLIADPRLDPNTSWTLAKKPQNFITVAIEKNQLNTLVLLLGRNDLVLSEDQVIAVLKFLEKQSASEISLVLSAMIRMSERLNQLKNPVREVKESKDAKEVKPLSIAKSVQGVSDFFKKINTKTHGVSQFPTKQNIQDATPLPPVLAGCVMQYLASDEFLKTQEAISELNQQGKRLGR